MRSPYGTKDHTLEKENQYKEGVKGRTIYGMVLIIARMATSPI